MEYFRDRITYFLIISIALITCFSCSPTHIDNGDNVKTYWVKSHKVFQNKVLDWRLEPIDKNHISFGEKPEGADILVEIDQANLEEDLYFITRGIDSLDSHIILEDSTLVSYYQSGIHQEDLFDQYHVSYTSVPIKFSNKMGKKLLLFHINNLNYNLSLYPFLIVNKKDLKKFQSYVKISHTIYIGGMAILICMAFVLLITFKSWLYFHYLLAALLSLGMMLINFNYYGLFLESIPTTILNKDIYGFFTLAIILNYYFFAQHFLEIKNELRNKIRKMNLPICLLVAGIWVLYFSFNLGVYKNRGFIEFTILILSILPLIILYFSLKKGYKPAFIFLFATTPIMIVGILESTSIIHKLPTQYIHELYYIATFWEIFILSIGLAIKFKTYQIERKIALESLIDHEFEARENERKALGQDLHDNISSLLSAIRINFKVFQQKHQVSESDSSFLKGMEILNITSAAIRSIAHRFTPPTLENLGLIEALKDIYAEFEHPRIYIDQIGFTSRLDYGKEQILFSIIQEAIQNILKHANANEVFILIKENNQAINVKIQDDGKGLYSVNLHGIGIKNMKYKSENLLKGTFEIKTDKESQTGSVILINFKR